MKKIVIVLIFIINLCFIGYAQSTSSSQISKIENSMWGFNYNNETEDKRLSRIENNVFGLSNSKLSIENRIKKLNEALGIESFEDSKKPAYEIDKTEIAEDNYPQIDRLEMQIFSTTYEKENIYKRLDRLEKKIFGSIQEGSLLSRTDRLKGYIKEDTIAKNPYQHVEQPYTPTYNTQNYSNTQDRFDSSDIQIQLAGLETVLFGKAFSHDPVGLRLNRLETRIFQRDFSSDDEYLRLQRLQAAANAQQTAKLYEANKVQKYTSTGLQIGSIILMILALIL